MAKYRILSLDGGGIRGLISVVLMQRLLENVPGWLDKVDLIAGTSTGGLIALGLAKGMSVEQLRNLYLENGHIIFDDSWIDDVKDIGKTFGADYDIKNLETVLKKFLGKTKLKDLNKKVLITAFSLDRKINLISGGKQIRTWAPKIFHNFEGSDSDGGELAYKVGLYTSAAPTYFESYDSYIDGGVFAGNPSMCALAQTQDSRSFQSGVKLEDILMLSIGTGYTPTYVEEKMVDWGYAQWAKPLVNLMLDGVSGIADFQCRQILKNNYSRLNIIFPDKIKIDMDDYKKMDVMIDLAMKADITECRDFLKNVWADESS